MLLLCDSKGMHSCSVKLNSIIPSCAAPGTGKSLLADKVGLEFYGRMGFKCAYIAQSGEAASVSAQGQTMARFFGIQVDHIGTWAEDAQLREKASNPAIIKRIAGYDVCVLGLLQTRLRVHPVSDAVVTVSAPVVVYLLFSVFSFIFFCLQKLVYFPERFLLALLIAHF